MEVGQPGRPPRQPHPPSGVSEICMRVTPLSQESCMELLEQDERKVNSQAAVYDIFLYIADRTGPTW